MRGDDDLGGGDVVAELTQAPTASLQKLEV
jgi:hypothetical protein